MLLTGLAVVPANATDVTYSTTGTFNCGTAVGCTLPGGVLTIASTTPYANTSTLTYIGQPSGSLTGLGTLTGDVGSIVEHSLEGPPDYEVFNGSTFTLTITQTVPGPTTSGSNTGKITGILAVSAEDIKITFANDGVVDVGGTTYTLGPTSNGVVSIPYSSIPIQATVFNSYTGNSTPTPEPGFLVLTGVGFLGLAGMALRRRRDSRVA